MRFDSIDLIKAVFLYKVKKKLLNNNSDVILGVVINRSVRKAIANDAVFFTRSNWTDNAHHLRILN